MSTPSKHRAADAAAAARMPDLQGGDPTTYTSTHNDSARDIVLSPDAPPPPPSSSHGRTDAEKQSLLRQAVHRLQYYAPPIESVRTAFDDFQDFIQQGNMVDLAVGLILGKAFTDILNSFVLDILSPIISLFSGASRMDGCVDG